MNTQTLLILAVIGAGGWWLWRENEKKKKLAAIADTVDIWNPSLAYKGETPKSTKTVLFKDVAVKI